ncbi:MAG: TRAP transporter substrate-binding protein [Xanthobacteraceae bacterium]|nr:TRAP transporter substrate-binding protein [Xanthobacteraceae bacterium]
MKPLRIAFAALAVSIGLGDAAQAQSLRIAGNFAPSHSSSRAMDLFKEELKRLSGGSLDADLFPGMQLGGAKENVDAVRAGTIFGTWVGTAFVSRLVPEIEAVSLPFLFDSRDNAFRVIDGPVGDLFEQRLGAKGFTALGWMELGSRQTTNAKRPIKALDDFKGLKIRMQPNETHLATFRALGANPIAMDVKELYSALQQGVVDGQENPYPIIQTNRFFEVQKYISNTNHFFDFILLIASKRQFEALKPEQKEMLKKAVKVAVDAQRKMAADEDRAALEDLKAKGMQFDAVSAQTAADLRKATAGVIDEVKKRAGAELVGRVAAEAQKK